jgi:hypothetical protein
MSQLLAPIKQVAENCQATLDAVAEARFQVRFTNKNVRIYDLVDTKRTGGQPRLVAMFRGDNWPLDGDEALELAVEHLRAVIRSVKAPTAIEAKE